MIAKSYRMCVEMVAQFFLSLLFILYNSSLVSSKSEKVNSDYKVIKYTNLTFWHAESPVWDGDSNTLYWVDVLSQNVHALHYYTGEHRIKHISYGELNLVIPVANSRKLLIGLKSQLCLLDWYKPEDSAIKCLVHFDSECPDNILNDGNVDALGRFWGGTKGRQIAEAVVPHEGAFYSVEAPSFIPRVHLKPVSISNGVAWSLNNTILYYTDSPTKKIEAFDFDLQKASLSKRRTIVDISEYYEDSVIPDGMTIDKDGFLWVALMFGGCIIRIDPDSRRIVDRYHLPVSRPTSVTWAGEDLADLVVTTSRRNLPLSKVNDEPLAGALFFMNNLGTHGVPSYKFIFPDADL